MKRMTQLSSGLGFAAILSLGLISGCNPAKDGGKDTTTPKAKDAAKDKEGKGAHDHGETGPHGGPLADWDDTYHAEFTVDHATKTATIYILDNKAKFAPKIDADKITNVILTITNVKPFVIAKLNHDAKQSNEKGIAFVGTHDFFAKPSEIKGQIDGTVDGNKFGNSFTYKPSDKAKSAMLKTLYTTPGGIYTAADIKANGATTAAEKFKGKVWDHDDNLKVGDRVCPVTNNKAEAACAWTVKSQSYEFCCPPCVDKFIGWAHHEPAKIKDAKEYVFRGM